MHSFKSPFLFKINYFEDDKWNIRNSEEIDPNKSKYFENDKWNIENIERIEKPFYQNQYFLIAISILSLSLLYYYWDNISELTSNLLFSLNLIINHFIIINNIRPSTDELTIFIIN